MPARLAGAARCRLGSLKAGRRTQISGTANSGKLPSGVAKIERSRLAAELALGLDCDAALDQPELPIEPVPSADGERYVPGADGA